MKDRAGQTDYQTQETSLNPIHGGILETLVHEALHHEAEPLLMSFGPKLREAIITRTLEHEIVTYINRTPSAQAFWYPFCLNLMDPS